MRWITLGAMALMTTALLVVGGCGGEDGPKISVALNIRNLCNYNIAPLTERRCDADQECNTGENEYCYHPEEGTNEEPPQYAQGFCRGCQTDGNCPVDERCDVGWCRTPCSASADCETGESCTGGFCRRPHIDGTNFAIGNEGNKDLEVYVSQTKLFGNEDACVFSRYEFEPPGQDTVTLAPGEEGLYLNVKFTPPELGPYRGFLEIHSNAINFEPLMILMCGQARDVECQPALGDSCVECTSCEFEDFKPLIDNHAEPDCSAFD